MSLPIKNGMMPVRDYLITFELMKSLLVTLALLATASVCSATTATITVSGGSGTGKLTITLDDDITLTTTADASSSNCLLVFDEAASTTVSAAGLTGSISIGGSSDSELAVQSGYSFGSVSTDDLYIYSSEFYRSGTALSSGTTITLSAGTYTSDSYYAGTVTSGTYTVFLVDGDGGLISTSSVPEPASCALFGGIGSLGLVFLRKRGNRKALQA